MADVPGVSYALMAGLATPAAQAIRPPVRAYRATTKDGEFLPNRRDPLTAGGELG
jgi:hypothetical protein